MGDTVFETKSRDFWPRPKYLLVIFYDPDFWRFFPFATGVTMFNKIRNGHKGILYRYSGAWGQLVHEKTWSWKSRGTVPLTDILQVRNAAPSAQLSYSLRSRLERVERPDRRGVVSRIKDKDGCSPLFLGQLVSPRLIFLRIRMRIRIRTKILRKFHDAKKINF